MFLAPNPIPTAPSGQFLWARKALPVVTPRLLCSPEVLRRQLRFRDKLRNQQRNHRLLLIRLILLVRIKKRLIYQRLIAQALKKLSLIVLPQRNQTIPALNSHQNLIIPRLLKNLPLIPHLQLRNLLLIAHLARSNLPLIAQTRQQQLTRVKNRQTIQAPQENLLRRSQRGDCRTSHSFLTRSLTRSTASAKATPSCLLSRTQPITQST
jgi:hypothetical protein